MSLVLGKIHHWLYNKILWFEGIEASIINWAEGKGLPIEEWTQRIYQEFGQPTQGKPLEEIIDTANIHGWLQDKITKAELRQAALVTEILKTKEEYKNDLKGIYAQQGVKAAQEYQGPLNIPEDVYNALNDFILEGMPCDRVNEVLFSDENEFAWETTTCLHTPYWEQVQGDVRNFYELREVWIKAFVEKLSSNFQYEKISDQRQRIIRK